MRRDKFLAEMDKVVPRARLAALIEPVYLKGKGGNGETADSVSKAMAVNIRTVFRCLADFSMGGQSALLVKPILGRPTKLGADEMSWIVKTVKDHTPQQFRFEFGLWILNIVRRLIKHHLKKDFWISSVHRIMKTLGFSAQKPLYQVWQQDAKLVRIWETETFPAIRAQAKKEGATIYFANESGLRCYYHKGTTWSPQGQLVRCSSLWTVIRFTRQ